MCRISQTNFAKNQEKVVNTNCCYSKPYVIFRNRINQRDKYSQPKNIGAKAIFMPFFKEPFATSEIIKTERMPGYSPLVKPSSMGIIIALLVRVNILKLYLSKIATALIGEPEPLFIFSGKPMYKKGLPTTCSILHKFSVLVVPYFLHHILVEIIFWLTEDCGQTIPLLLLLSMLNIDFIKT
jgi:hypothetical protein